jgi:hypothetical protein
MFPLFDTGVVDTVATSIHDTGGKFVTITNNTSSTENFATGVVIDTSDKSARGAGDTGGNFATGVVDTSGRPYLANISENF